MHWEHVSNRKEYLVMASVRRITSALEEFALSEDMIVKINKHLSNLKIGSYQGAGPPPRDGWRRSSCIRKSHESELYTYCWKAREKSVIEQTATSQSRARLTRQELRCCPVKVQAIYEASRSRRQQIMKYKKSNVVPILRLNPYIVRARGRSA
jgi:hypothetical protein